MVDYLKVSARLLKRKRMIETAMQSLREQIGFLEQELTACRTSSFERISSCGSYSNTEEDSRLALLCKLDDFRARYRILREQYDMIERGFAALTPYQADVLETFFVKEERYRAENLCARYFKERSQIYRDRIKALKRFSFAVFGASGDEDDVLNSAFGAWGA